MTSLQWSEANSNVLLSHALMPYSLCGGESLTSAIYSLLKRFLAFILIYLQSYVVYVAITAMAYFVESMLGKRVISDYLYVRGTITG